MLLLGVEMYDCEICGKKTPTLYVIDVEGAEMTTCASCAAGKNIEDTIEAADVNKKPVHRTAAQEEPQEEMVEDFGGTIRKARESMGIALNVLAEMINEKESTLNRVEQGKMQPTVALTKKLEKQLGIKLTTIAEGSGGKEKAGKDAPITLGDAAFKK